MHKILKLIKTILAMSKIIKFPKSKAAPKPEPAPVPQPEQPKTRFLFTPEKNITAYELAMCMMHLFGKPITIEDAREKYMRHFTMQKAEPQAEPEK